MINAAGKNKSNDITDHKDTDEDFTLVKSKKHKSKLSDKDAAKSDEILRINDSENKDGDVEITSLESDS